MSDITISRAGPADLDALALLFDAYRQFYCQSSDVPRARDWLRSRLRVGESVVLLARRGGAMLGFVQLYPMFSSVRTAKTWILNDLYVDAGARRRGVAGDGRQAAPHRHAARRQGKARGGGASRGNAPRAPGGHPGGTGKPGGGSHRTGTRHH